MDRNLLNYNKPTVEELFSNKRYQVPKYQRAYAWDQEKAEKFYQDIFASTGDYFLGSILLTDKSREENFYEIIDGQQRITTISLFLFALYLVFKEVSDSEAGTYIHAKYLMGGDLNIGTYQVVQLGRHNRDFFCSILEIKSIQDVGGLNPNGTNKNILNVLNYFIDKISKEKKPDIHLERKRLVEILTRITKQVFFFEIIVPDNVQASRLFEVLNNRGEDLNDTDLVRNYLLSKADTEGFQESIDSWGNIEDKIGVENLEQFLRYSSFLVSKKETTYERIVEYTENGSSKTTIIFLSDLVDFYLKIIEPNSYDEDVEGDLLEDLSLFGVTQIRSILLAASKKFNANDLISLIEALKIFIFRYSVICGKNPNKIELLSQNMSYQIFNKNISLAALLNEMKSIDPSEDEFNISFTNKDFKSHKIPKYILEKIEDSMSVGDKEVSRASVHLEHIMPKKIDKWALQDKYYDNSFHKNYLNKIGNMVLLHVSINTSIKNSLFGTKKQKYKGDINLLDDIIKRNEWKENDITWNSNRYLEQAKKIWPKIT